MVKRTGVNPMADVEILRAACCVAGLDGRVCERERALLHRLAKKAGVGAASLDAMIDTAVEDKAFYEKQFRVVQADAERTIKTLLAVAISDGDLALEERVIIQKFADVLGMDRDRYDALLLKAKSQLARDAKSPPPAM